MSEKIERLPLAKAITRGLEDAMEADRTVVMLGEDIGKLGGVYRVTEGLQARFGTRRVMDAPLGESGIIGTSIGMACRRFSSTASCSPPTTRSRASWRRSTTAPISSTRYR